MNKTEIVIIGAGPSGTIAGALLRKKGYQVKIFEKTQFPRFVIGESLLPNCMNVIEQAGMLEAVNNAGFQLKNGAAFSCGSRTSAFDFSKKTSKGHGSTFQVQRAEFDKLLADTAQDMGVEIYYNHEITAFDYINNKPLLSYIDHHKQSHQIEAKFVLDASGYGRVLPRLFDLEIPSKLPQRQAVFSHIEDMIDDSNYDRNKILISIHPQNKAVWYWLIPFAKGRSSLGVVAPPDYIESLATTPLEQLQQAVKQNPPLNALLNKANYDTKVQVIEGYSSNVKSLYGAGFALLGNAGEFLDPVFSSGVTIAMESAAIAAPLVDKVLQGKTVDWQTEYSDPLMKGVDTFRAFVNAWYDERLQDIILHPDPNDKVKSLICSILAGYAWDKDNPYVQNSESRLNVLAELCRT